jgi:hypothetical protein
MLGMSVRPISPLEVDPETISEAETRRIMAKYRAERARKTGTEKRNRGVTLPYLSFLGDWKAEKAEDVSRV